MEKPKKSRRVFTPDQKVVILQKIDAAIKSGSPVSQAVEDQGIAYSVYRKWKKQFTAGVRSSLRNGKAPIDKEKKAQEKRIQKLEKIVVSQAQTIAALKKETNWES